MKKLSTMKLGIPAIAAAGLAALGGVALANGGHGGPRRADMLKKFDTNGDGKLDATERKAAHAAMQKEHEARRAAMLEKYDANDDGVLDESERDTMHEDLAAARFSQLDKNGDGVLSFDEFKAGRPDHPPGPPDDH